MKRMWRLVAWVAGLAALVVLVTPLLNTSLTNKPKEGGASGDKSAETSGHRGRRGGGDTGGPVPVLTARSRQADVPVYVEGVGTGQALNSVLIRTQVDGTLNALNFTEGQKVKAGDTIAKIDPRLYQATYDQDVAKKKLDEATLANAYRDLARYKQLSLTKAVTQQQYDTQVATVASDEAQVQVDQAMIDSAATTLSYTNITSPIAGLTGIRNVDVGNLLHATDTTGIVTVSQIQPISVIFNIPQQDLPLINKASLLNQLYVQGLYGSGKAVIDHGALAVVNNTIDSTTGTVKLKANFGNPQLQLWPGIFTNVRLRVETLHDAITVPIAALQQGPNGQFVFTVVDGKAAMRPVNVGQQDDVEAVVTTGIKAGDVVITSGFQKLTDGARVKPAEDSSAAATDAPALHHQDVSPPKSGTAPADADAPATAPQHRRGGHRQSASE